MGAPKEGTLISALEYACINSFIPSKLFNWTPSITPQLIRFATNFEQAIVAYVTTPAFVFQGVVPPTASVTAGFYEFVIIHNLGYIPSVNPVEKQEFITSRGLVFRVSNSMQTNRPQILEITNTYVTIYAYVGDTIRIVMW